ncbi:peptidylprolyl isomerase [Leptolyngbya sp. FACHB-261]|nr:peptidylprolyl isomerase [Leptolyngbya sp. FACHB-261]
MAEAFLSVDDQPIPLSQALRYLQASGNLQPFIGQILRQYLLEQELAARDSIQVESSLIEQAVIDFRLNNQLTDPKAFQEWLAKNGLDYNGFHNQIVSSFKLEKLKAEITEPKLQEYFIDRKIFLDRVVLSRIIVAEKELAEELRSQIEEGTRFEQLAREYSITDDRVVNGMMGPVSRGQMPDGLRALVDQASPGELIGPLQIDDRYCLFRLEDFLPASLDGPLQQELQNQLFEQWIGEKMQTMTIKLQVG